MEHLAIEGIVIAIMWLIGLSLMGLKLSTVVFQRVLVVLSFAVVFVAIVFLSWFAVHYFSITVCPVESLDSRVRIKNEYLEAIIGAICTTAFL